MALVEVSPLFEGEEHAKIEASIDRAQAWLLEFGSDLRRSAPDMYDDYFGNALYNVWGHSYGIQAARGVYTSGPKAIPNFRPSSRSSSSTTSSDSSRTSSSTAVGVITTIRSAISTAMRFNLAGPS